MRGLIFIGLLMIVSFLSVAQTDMFMQRQVLHRQIMDIHEVNFDGVVCYDSIQVIWGTDEADTTCFVFNFKAHVFYPVKKKAWQLLPSDQKTYIKRYINRNSQVNNKLYLRQDQFNEIYTIRIVLTDLGLSIFITNINYGIPSYTLSWGMHCNLCD